MKSLQVAKDIVPLADFKAQSASWLERVRASGRPIVITQNGKPAAVLISPEEYDRFQNQSRDWVRAEIMAGERDVSAGQLLDTKSARGLLAQRRKSKGR